MSKNISYSQNDSLFGIVLYDSAFQELNKNSYKAVELFNEAEIYLLRSKNYSYYIAGLNSKSYYFYYNGDYIGFEKSTKKAFKDSQLFLDELHPMAKDAKYYLSLYFDLIGDNFKSKQLLLELATIEDTSLVIDSYRTLSEIEADNGAFEESLNYIKLAKFYSTKGFENKLPSLHYSHGVVYSKLGSIQESQIYFYKAKKEFERYGINVDNKFQLKTLYFSLAQNYLELSDYEKSEEFIYKVFKLHFKNEIYKRRGWELLGKIEHKRKNFTKSNQYIKNALKIIEDQYKRIPKNRNRAEYYYEFAKNFYFLNKIDSTKFFINKSIETIKFNNNTYISGIMALKFLQFQFKILIEEFREFQKINVLFDCIDNFKECLAIINQLHNSYISHESKLFLQENSISIIEGAIEVCYELYKRTGEEKYIEQAFAYAENLKAKTLLGEMRENDALKLTGLPDTLREQERDLRIEIAFYERQINEEMQKKDSEEDKIKLWESELFQLNNDYNDLITGIENDFPKFKMMRNYQNDLNLDQIRNELLDEETLILEYFVGEKQAFVFAFGKNELQLIPLDSSAFISNEGEALLHYINAPPITGSNVSTTLQKQADFSNAIFHKAMDQLKNDYKKIIVIPDNVLSYLPFEVLLDKDVKTDSPMLPKEAYVLDDYQFSYNYSIVLLLNKLEQEATAKEAFVGYSPSFSDKMTEATRSCTTDELYSLRCSEKEITSISEILGGKTYTGTLAGKEAFKTEAANYKIIHLATHACIDEENPRFNKIYLADDYLSNGDIQNMDFSADLAVLSACNTGTGKLAKGEGVLSLSRDFIYAGCASILTSLWSVDDCSTSDIMVNYYQNLAEGLPKDASLQKAKIDFIENGDKLKSHPYYWAPFVQIGNTEPLDLGKGMPWYWWLVGGIGALAALGLYRKFNT